MDAHITQSSHVSIGLRIASAVALIFGVITLFSAGGVLFGPETARDLAGDFVPFIVWFNFGAGAFYIIASTGIWLNQHWAKSLSLVLALATSLAALAFVFYINSGNDFEMRTVGALILRAGFWAGIFLALRRQKS